MNLSRINEIRAAAGLPALVSTKTSAEARKRTQRNRQARAAENRELKAARQRKGK